MNKTLRISFSLKNTYRVNSILYALKQIPLLKKALPQFLYQVRGLKIFANIISAIWEIVSVFLGKILYLLLMVTMALGLYQTGESRGLFLHILFFLTVIGAFSNTYMFNPTRDKYYAMILMRMNARSYTLVNYTYAMLKTVVGFLAGALIFGRRAGVPFLVCMLIPFFVAGAKMTVAAYSLWDYERTGRPANENKLGKLQWTAIFLLLAAAYGLPAAGILVPEPVLLGLMCLPVLTGLVSIGKILGFRQYYEVYREILAQAMEQMESIGTIAQDQSKKLISTDVGIVSKRKGFEYLNELFIKRHKKILWRSSKRIAAVCACLVLAALLAFYLQPVVKDGANALILTYLPYFVFIMYCINRGTGFTRALFMNCDRSLLTYSFYKESKCILKLFQIRLREIIKINLLPALVIGAGLALLLYASGGTADAMNYVILIVSVGGMSVFFSVHYLTIYYLLQPFNAGTEMKSGMYQVIMSATYLVCFFLMQLRMSTLVFGIMVIVFCLVYCVVACILVKKLAPKTFRLRI